MGPGLVPDPKVTFTTGSPRLPVHIWAYKDDCFVKRKSIVITKNRKEEYSTFQLLANNIGV